MLSQVVYVFLSLHLLVCLVSGEEDVTSLLEIMRDMDEEIRSVKSDMCQLENTISRKLDLAVLSTRSSLKQYFRQQVKKAVADILQGESLEEIFRGHVVSELKKLKQRHQEMKKQLQNVTESLREVQRDQETCKDLLKTGENISELKTCSKYVVDSQILQRDLDQYKQEAVENIKEINELKQSLVTLNETNQSLLRELDTSSSKSDKGLTSTSVVTTSTSDTTTTSPSESTSTSTPSTSTATSEEGRNRIIITRLETSPAQFRQVDIPSYSESDYPSLHLDYVSSLTYVSKLRKLIVSVWKPKGILSAPLDDSKTTTLVGGVVSNGMAVDEDRELVFMTTYAPINGISRMSTQGEHYTVVTRLYKGYGSPITVAVNPRDMVLYVCNWNKLFSMRYDGSILEVLDTGEAIYDVTFDRVANSLYYNNEEKLLQFSLSQNTSTEVTVLRARPWTLTYYNGTVYYGGFYKKIVGTVDLRSDDVSQTIKTLDIKSNGRIIICLVP